MTIRSLPQSCVMSRFPPDSMQCSHTILQASQCNRDDWDTCRGRMTGMRVRNDDDPSGPTITCYGWAQPLSVLPPSIYDIYKMCSTLLRFSIKSPLYKSAIVSFSTRTFPAPHPCSYPGLRSGFRRGAAQAMVAAERTMARPMITMTRRALKVESARAETSQRILPFSPARSSRNSATRLGAIFGQRAVIFAIAISVVLRALIQSRCSSPSRSRLRSS
jgi:hypothetical protein